jgi:DNA-directed RNA polymerase I subunit RPA12
MAAIGSLVFCTDCGNLLPVSKGNVKNILHCDCCGADNKGWR